MMFVDVLPHTYTYLNVTILQLLQGRLEEQASMLLLERKTREDIHVFFLSSLMESYLILASQKYFESLETTNMV